MPLIYNFSNVLMSIEGFYYVPNYLTNEEVTRLTDYCKKSDMTPIGKNAASRRVLQFGYSYAYDRSGVKPIMAIPHILKDIVNPTRVNKAIGTNILTSKMEQLIINEYNSGQGISQHIDHVKYFGPVIICITIGSGIEIKFSREGDVVKKYVDIGSLYVMSGDARYKWKHGIAERESDGGVARRTRYSLTYRTINDDIKKEIDTPHSFKANHALYMKSIDNKYMAILDGYNKINKIDN